MSKSSFHGMRPGQRRPRTHWLRGVAAAVLALTGQQAAQAETLIGLTQNWMLVSFDSAAPSLGSTPVSIFGLQANEVVVGIDLRPSTGVIYGLGSNSNLYTLNASTGQASFVASLTGAGTGAAYALNQNAAYGVDFNPVPDLGQTLPSLRVVNTSGDNLRINVNGASAGQVSVDAALNPGTARIVGSAYTNNDRDPATATALYGIDASNSSLVLQSPPNNGTLSFIGGLGVETSALVGFDISGATGRAYASLTNPLTGSSSLYTVNLGTGAATLLGAYGVQGNTSVSATLRDITVAPVPEPSTYAMMLAGLGALGFALRKRREPQA